MLSSALEAPTRAPRRLSTHQRRFSPQAVFVGRPTLWSNPFERSGISQARSAILYRAWVAGELNFAILRRARFSIDEIGALDRWRDRLLPRLHQLAGRSLVCTCPLRSSWCHAALLLRMASPDLIGSARNAARKGVADG